MTGNGTGRLLIVLTGPVGGGKSTTALRLAERLRAPCSNGSVRRVAAVDLDLVADMIRPQVHYGEPDLWQMARTICGGLADAIYEAEHDTVIVEGEFFSAAELAALCAAVSTPVLLRVITLNVSYEVCLVRVANDPGSGRNLSRHPTFLREMNVQFRAALPWLRAVGAVIDADTASASELAEAICLHLGPVSGRN